ncbi:hypothetical protein NDU88_002188 [Pleurodeles waltl]|uniref:Uncharacterized protein n=1 Tax=Pleurodeles waltl TaxID=8319 RepID=A0AAV7WP61_PLEWA|nr:hypothetical protein NDU88_002188 [Pleurodeles waltl]
MGTLQALVTRFPVYRETLEDFRGTEAEKEEESVTRGERVERGNEFGAGRTGENQRDETDEESAGAGDEEKEATHGEEPDQESRRTSHDPGGSWLTKVIHWSRPSPPETIDLGRKKKKRTELTRELRKT